MIGGSRSQRDIKVLGRVNADGGQTGERELDGLIAWAGERAGGVEDEGSWSSLRG